MALGKASQRCFELYFNQQVNLKPGGEKQSVMMKCVERILHPSTNYVNSLEIKYPFGKGEEDFLNDVRDQVRKGHAIMERMGLIKLAVQSEKKWNSVFRGVRLFALIDFMREGRSGCYLFDGKGHAKVNADPRQLHHYALTVIASGRTVKEAGLIYWNHGYVPVDVSPKAVKQFVDETLMVAKPTFNLLQAGVSGELKATPSLSVCGDCNWRNICDHSARKNPPMDASLPEHTGFGDNPSGV